MREHINSIAAAGVGIALLGTGYYFWNDMNAALERNTAEFANAQIGTLVTLKIGEKYETPGRVEPIIYAGMPNDKTFALIFQKQGMLALYYPSNTQELRVDKHNFHVEKVTPENLILKYLGYQPREFK